jgi:hypothetical protein
MRGLVPNSPESRAGGTSLPKGRRARLLAVLAALALTGCVDSTDPIITDAQPMFGPQVRLHAYSLIDGQASGPETGTFRWDRAHYRPAGRSTFKISELTMHLFAGNDLIVQSRSTERKDKHVEYALARKLADAVYLIIAIDEDDADEATRAKFCTKSASSSCNIATREALMAFAQATAARPDAKGGLALIAAPTGR